jgi:amino-acid N-acetyltransferase
MVHANDYDRIRPAKKKDAQSLYNLARHGARSDTLVARSRQQIEQSIGEFVVYEIDDSIIGCAALRRYESQPTLMEIGAVYVQPFYHGRGVGTKLVEYIKRKAKQAGARKLIALSTQTQGFFTASCGFEEGSVADLPASRRKELRSSGRNSRVLTFPLSRFTASPR